jgi:hypothetical protein
MEFSMHGLVRKGFEIVGAHYMDPKLAKGKPSVCTFNSKRPRNFVNMWQGQLHSMTQSQMNFLVQHARRDVQIHDLRIESKMYKGLVCGNSQSNK